MNWAEWARPQDLHPPTVYRWFLEGTLPVPAVRVNQRTVLVSPNAPIDRGTVSFGLYARVSSHNQMDDLDRQVRRLTAWAAEVGGQVVRVVGSGMNGSWAKVRRLLADPNVTGVVVEHRDLLGRVNTELNEAALSAQGTRPVILDEGDDGEKHDDVMRDMVEVLTWLCARLYGRRAARDRALRRSTAPNVTWVRGGPGCSQPVFTGRMPVISRLP